LIVKSVEDSYCHFSSRWPSKPTTSTEATKTEEIKTTSTTIRTKPKASIAVQDISAFLPPGYKLKKEDAAVTENSLLSEILAKSKVDISSLLPPGYDKKKVEEESKSKNITTTTTTTTTTTAKSTGVSPEKIASSIQDLFASSKVDISALLPKDYAQKKELSDSKATDDTNSEQNTTVTERIDSESSTTKKAGGLKIVFPSRPGGRKPIHKITTPQTPRGEAPGVVTPKIQKGWPTR